MNQSHPVFIYYPSPLFVLYCRQFTQSYQLDALLQYIHLQYPTAYTAELNVDFLPQQHCLKAMLFASLAQDTRIMHVALAGSRDRRSGHPS